MSECNAIDVTLGLADLDQLHRIVLDKVADGVYYTDTNRRILFWNRSAEHLTGFASDQVLGTRCADNILKHVDETGRNLCENACPLSETMEDGVSREAHVFLHHKDGYRLPVCVRTAALQDRYGRIIGAVETFSDDTTHMADLLRIRQLEEIAFLDELTGLANRRYLQNAIANRLAESQRHDCPFGVILADVDYFKQVNDRYGHDVGDRALQVVANTLAHNCRPYDMVGRWGGDEFLIVAGHTSKESIESLANRLRALVSQSTLSADGESVQVAISIGATKIRTGDTFEQLFKRADDLLLRSKAQGRNRVTFEP